MDKDNELDIPTTSSSGTFPSVRSGSSDNIFYDIESDASSSSLTPYAEQPSESLLHHVDERTPLRIAFTSPTESKNDKGTKFAILKSNMKKIKPIFLFLCCIACAVLFVWNPENSNPSKLICVSNNSPENLKVGDKYTKLLTVTLVGPFYEEGNKGSSNVLTIGLAQSKSGYLLFSENFTIDIKSSKEEINAALVTKTIKFVHPEAAMYNDCMVLRLSLDSEEHYPVAFSVTYFSETATENTQIVLAFVILVAVYILIIFELVHRTTAAMFGAFVALSVLSYLNKRPTLEVVLMWVQWETLSLLFGMMILVAVFAKTGFFDYIALKAYKISRGHVWALITLLCLITGVVSAFLDNVTTILLLTPVTIRLCQVLNLDPTYVLIAEVIFSNIGGTATAIGDPPNILLASHTQIINAGINFTDFTKHLSLGIVFCMITGYGCLRILYLRVRLENPDPPEIAELKREVEIWRRTAHRVPYSSPEEKTVKLLLIQKTLMLENTIRNMERRQTRKQAFDQKLKQLESEYKITDFPLLIKTGFVILLVIALFFLEPFLPELVFPVGWIAVIGAIALILLADIENIEELMEKVEWTTLVFFAALFVLMKALGFLGLFEYLSLHTASLIEGVSKDYQLGVAIVAILWISALASSFVDNIPFTAAMIPITLDLNAKNGLDLGPLVWALSMGACLGGNGTLIGASANVVCAGLAEQYGYPISFNKFTKIGFPMMLVTVTVATGYLLICHVAL